MSPAPYMEPILAWTTLLGLRSARSPIHQRMRESLGVLISALQRGGSVVIWVDGPTGPRRRAKPGCIEIAQQANVPIIPVACWSRTNVRAWWRWDQALFPVPGDRVDVVFGDVIPVPQGVSPDSLLPQIDAALNALAPLEEGSLAKMRFVVEADKVGSIVIVGQYFLGRLAGFCSTYGAQLAHSHPVTRSSADKGH